MILQTYTAAAQFLDHARVQLEKDEVVNNLILGLSLRLVEEPGFYGSQPYFSTVETGSAPGEGELLAAALMTPPHNLLLYPASPRSSEALPWIADSLIHAAGTSSSWNVPGVLAPQEIAADFAALWSRRTGQLHHLFMRERVYELRQVIPPRHPGGRLRKAGGDDIDLVLRWTLEFEREVFGHENPEPILPEEVQRRIQGMYLWVNEENQPVSMAAVGRHTPHGSTVGPVYTPPELRRRGYAGACVASVSQIILDSGKRFCALFTDLANPTSNHVYQAIGYRPLCDFHEYHFES
jgi:predicted GNAT family acetyltransferase